MNKDQLGILLSGSENWSVWCRLNPGQTIDLQDASLPNADLRNIFLRDANLQGANLQGANLQGAILQGANLEGANLRGADLTRCNLSKAKLLHADLQKAVLQKSEMQFAKLYDANLEGADLEGARMLGVDLRRANMKCANLTGAKLLGANLIRANLSGANLTKTNFHNCSLSGVRMESANLDQTIFSSKTVINDFFHPLKDEQVNGALFKDEEQRWDRQERVRVARQALIIRLKNETGISPLNFGYFLASLEVAYNNLLYIEQVSNSTDVKTIKNRFNHVFFDGENQLAIKSVKKGSVEICFTTLLGSSGVLVALSGIILAISTAAKNFKEIEKINTEIELNKFKLITEKESHPEVMEDKNRNDSFPTAPEDEMPHIKQLRLDPEMCNMIMRYLKDDASELHSHSNELINKAADPVLRGMLKMMSYKIEFDVKYIDERK